MIGDVMIGTNNLQRAANFYDPILALLGLVQVEISDRYVAYAPETALEAIELYVTTPFNEQTATVGNGSMLALKVDSISVLELFHENGLKNGNVYEIGSGPRIDGSAVQYAFFRDLDGNKLCAYCEEVA